MKTLGVARPWPLVLCLFVIAMTASRCYLATHTGLAPDEAYYWTWSKNLALSYPDHPPLVAWLIRLSTAILGDNALGVRLPGIVGSVVAIVLAYCIAIEVGLKKKHAEIAAILSSLIIAPAGAALVVTPDTPLGILWLAAAFLLIRLSHGAGSHLWYLLAVVVSLSILSKYSGLLLIGLILAVCIKERGRMGLSRHQLLAAGVMIVLLLPHLFSEWRFGFTAGRFQERHLLGELPMAQVLHFPERLIALLLGQIGLLTPLIAVFLIRTLRENPSHLQVLSIGFLLPFFATAAAAILTHPEQNWASLGHPGAAILAVYGVSELGSGKQRRWWMIGVAGSAVLFSAVAHIHLINPFLPLPPKRDPTARLHGFDALKTVSSLLPGVEGIVCDNYGLASQVSWQFRDREMSIPVVGLDRASWSNNKAGHLLLLDQVGDVAGATIPLSCNRIKPEKPILLRLKSRGVWDRVQVSLGEGCRISSNTVVSSFKR